MPSTSDHTFQVTALGHRLQARRLRPEGDLPGAPTLVLLHDGLGSISQWGDFPLRLAEVTRWPVLAYDRAGHGGSEARKEGHRPDFLEEEALGVLPRVLEACEVAAPVLVGHSDGGSLALLFAAAFPTVPRALVTEAAHVLVEATTEAGLRATVAAYGRSARFREGLQRHHGSKADALFRGWSSAWLTPERRAWSIVDRLPAIVAPILAIQGLEDEYGTPAQVERIVQGTSGPAEALLIAGCGHTPHHQARDRVLEGIRAFFARRLSPGGTPLI